MKNRVSSGHCPRRQLPAERPRNSRGIIHSCAYNFLVVVALLAWSVLALVVIAFASQSTALPVSLHAPSRTAIYVLQACDLRLRATPHPCRCAMGAFPARCKRW